MKPNFALSLSADGVRLLHRAAGGWRLVGSVSLDDADFDASVASLRADAAALSPDALCCKVIIPNDQIKYLTVPTGGMDRTARRNAAQEALENTTPYAIADLAYDISVDGDNTHVAAVAKETLAEAEGFAVQHRFGPLSFVAVPGEQTYLGEPFFGPSDKSKDLLDQGQEVEPDGIAVVVIGEADIPAAPKPQTDAAPKPPADEKPATDTPAPEKTAAPAPEKPAAPADKPAAADTARAEPTPAAPASEPAAPSASVEKPATAAEADKPAQTPSRPAVETSKDAAKAASAPPVPPAPAAPSIPPAPTAAAPLKPDTPTPAPTVPKAPPADAAVPTAAPAATTKGETKTPVLPSFSAARERLADRPVAGTNNPSLEAETVAAAPTAGFASRRGSAAADSKPAMQSTPTAPAPVSPPSAPPVAAKTPPPLPAAKPLAETLVARAGGDTAVTAKAPAAAKPRTSGESPTSLLGRLKPETPPMATQKSVASNKTPPAVVAAATSEADRMTVFGARQNNVGGKPRFLGLILVAGLLLFLAVVAAWASVAREDGLTLSRLFGDPGPRASDPALVQTQTSDGQVLPAPGGIAPDLLPQEPDTTAQAEPVRTASLDPGLSDEDGAVLDALRQPVPAADTRPLSQGEIDAKYAATGIYARAPEVPVDPAAQVDLDNLYLTSIDPISTANDAIALPAQNSFASDTLVANVSAPALKGARFSFDDRGFIVPKEQGIVTPAGYTLFAGRPALLPPANVLRGGPLDGQAPAEETPAPQDTVETPEATETTPTADTTTDSPAVDATPNPLAEFRPTSRPNGLIERTERAQLGGVTRSELELFRPRLRPQSVQEEAAATQTAVTPQDTAAAITEALETPQAAPVDTATALAARASLRPDTRPRNFSRIVKRAQRSKPAEQETRVASAASIAPRTVTPKIPTKTSVARAATVRNAINLKRVNLIGVYGKPSSRRALVRLGNGRYRKVEVGDRIDGGRVSAIGNSELRYTKGGRNVVLKMPRG